jgi:hypothetical protein
MPAFTETTPSAELLLTKRAVMIVVFISVGIVNSLTLILSNGVAMLIDILVVIRAPVTTTSDVPAALWAPLYLILRDYKVCIS